MERQALFTGHNIPRFHVSKHSWITQRSRNR